MLIKVTQEHIDKGVKSSCMFCPIALAIKDATDTYLVSVSNEIAICNNAKVKTFKRTEKITHFMILFDNAKHVEPFEFELEGF